MMEQMKTALAVQYNSYLKRYLDSDDTLSAMQISRPIMECMAFLALCQRAGFSPDEISASARQLRDKEADDLKLSFASFEEESGSFYIVFDSPEGPLDSRRKE